VCENNLYATEVPLAKATKNPNIASRAAAYGLPGVSVDGSDVLAMYQAAGDAVVRARAGDGPTLIEARTYRFRAHAEGMRESGYRSKEEMAAWRERDPIQLLGQRLVAEGLATDADLEKIADEVTKVIEEAVEYAENSPWPDPATVADHIFSEMTVGGQHA
jgi:2-oxoisovalerate dehydrogenase E1 component